MNYLFPIIQQFRTLTTTCYIELTKVKELKQIQNYVQEKRDAYYRVKKEDSKLYAVWSGKYRSDLFEIDDIELYGKEYVSELK